MNAPQKPSIGRIVLYTRMSKALGIHPAIIMEVDATDPELVDLTVFGPNGPEIWTRVPMTSAPPVAGRWHWPPRI